MSKKQFKYGFALDPDPFKWTPRVPRAAWLNDTTRYLTDIPALYWLKEDSANKKDMEAAKHIENRIKELESIEKKEGTDKGETIHGSSD